MFICICICICIGLSMYIYIYIYIFIYIQEAETRSPEIELRNRECGLASTRDVGALWDCVPRVCGGGGGCAGTTG